MSKSIYLLLLLFIIKQLILVFLIPPWSADDEPGHIAYVMYLFHKKDIPSKKKLFVPVSMWYSMASISPTLKQLKSEPELIPQKQELFYRNDSTNSPYNPDQGAHPPLYYLFLLPFYSLSLAFSSYWSIVFLRCGSLIIGVGSLYITYLIAREVFLDMKMPVLLTALVSLQPMFSFSTSVVNNDNLTIFLFLLVFYRSILLLKKTRYSKKDAILDGIFLAAGALTKAQLLSGFLIYFIAAKVIKGIPVKLVTLALVIGGFFVLAWYGREFMLDGTGIISNHIMNMQPEKLSILRYPDEFIRGKFPLFIFATFWGWFGWHDTPMPKYVYLLYFFVIGAGYLAWLINGRHLVKYYSRTLKLKILLFTIFSIIVYIGTIFVFDLLNFIISSEHVIFGRYFLPILPLLLMLLLIGVRFAKKDLNTFFIRTYLAIFVIGQVFMFITLSYSYYGDILPKLHFLRIYG